MIKRASDDTMRLLMALATDAWLSENGIVHAVNDQLLRHLRKEHGPKEPTGRGFWELLDPRETPRVHTWYDDWSGSSMNEGHLEVLVGLDGVSDQTSMLRLFRLGTLELGLLSPCSGSDPKSGSVDPLVAVSLLDAYLQKGAVGLLLCVEGDDGKPCIHYMNDKAMELLNLRKRKLEGYRLEALVHPDDVRTVEEAFKEAFGDGEMLSPMEVRFLDQEGEIDTLELVLGPLTWEGRRAAFIMMRDVTERALLFSELRRYAEAFEVLQDTVVLADGNFNILYVNPAGLRRSGYHIDDVVGKPIHIFAAMRSDEEDPQQLASALLKEGIWRGQRWARRSDGAQYPVDILVTMQRDDEGNPSTVTVVSRDISLLRANENRLRQERERAEFLRDLMSHDINNHIQGVMGRLELLMRTQLDEGQKRHARHAMEQARRTSDLVARVRSLSLVRQGKAPKEVRLLDVLDRCIKDLKEKYKDIPIEVTSTPSLGDVILLADDLLDDLIINIMDNAIKHSVATPVHITVDSMPRWESGRRTWRLEIADNGPGLTDAEKDEVFFKMVRREGRTEASGLGLSLVLAIVERYGGQVRIEDRVAGDHSQGAKFVLELPGV